MLLIVYELHCICTLFKCIYSNCKKIIVIQFFSFNSFFFNPPVLRNSTLRLCIQSNCGILVQIWVIWWRLVRYQHAQILQHAIILKNYIKTEACWTYAVLHPF